MPVIPNYDSPKGPECDKQLDEEQERRYWCFFRWKIFNRGVGIGTQPQRQPEQKRTEQGTCGDWISS